MDLKPVYEFEFSDGTTRRTDNIDDPNRILGEQGVEFLAELVLYHDPEAEVNLVGYET